MLQGVLVANRSVEQARAMIAELRDVVEPELALAAATDVFRSATPRLYAVAQSNLATILLRRGRFAEAEALWRIFEDVEFLGQLGDGEPLERKVTDLLRNSVGRPLPSGDSLFGS